MKTKISIIVLVVVATCAAVLGWNKKSMNAVEANSKARTISPAEKSGIPPPQVKVASPIHGKIREIRVEEGDRIQRGQLIAILENSDSTARVTQAEAQFEQREAELGQLNGAANMALLRKAKADVERARLEMEEARSSLLKTFIRSPINGVLLRKKAKPGESVSADGWIAIIQAGSSR